MPEFYRNKLDLHDHQKVQDQCSQYAIRTDNELSCFENWKYLLGEINGANEK